MVKNRILYFRARANVNTGWLHWLFKNESEHVSRIKTPRPNLSWVITYVRPLLPWYNLGDK